MYLSIPTILLGYLLGSIPPSYLIGKYFYNIDIRQVGSGNVGGANAARTMGKKVGAITAVVDIFKGTLAVYLATLFAKQGYFSPDIILDTNITIAMTGFAAIFGHCYSIFLKFKGGKGGATTAGVTLFLSPFTFLILLTIWLLVVGSTRFTSLGNLLAVWVIPITFSITGEDISRRLSDEINAVSYIVFSYAVVLLIYVRHKDNISRLLAGNERKFGQKEQI